MFKDSKITRKPSINPTEQKSKFFSLLSFFFSRKRRIKTNPLGEPSYQDLRTKLLYEALANVLPRLLERGDVASWFLLLWYVDSIAMAGPSEKATSVCRQSRLLQAGRVEKELVY
jgi:hypothetical protein